MASWRALIAVGAILLCAGCTVSDDSDASITASESVVVSASPGSSERDIEFAKFNAALNGLVSSDVPVSETILSALEKQGGFGADKLTINADRTPTNLVVDTISVAYSYDSKTCFIGQFVTKKFVSEVASPVNGACLVGQVAR